MKEVRDRLDKILDRLPTPQAITGSSPLQLTEYGERISKLSGAKDIALRISKLVSSQVAGFQDYEIQVFCEEYMKNDFQPTHDEDTKN